MLYKTAWIWLAIQIPLGLVTGLTLRGFKVADAAEQNDEPDAKAAAALAGKAMELEAG